MPTCTAKAFVSTVTQDSTPAPRNSRPAFRNSADAFQNSAPATRNSTRAAGNSGLQLGIPHCISKFHACMLTCLPCRGECLFRRARFPRPTPSSPVRRSSIASAESNFRLSQARLRWLGSPDLRRVGLLAGSGRELLLAIALPPRTQSAPPPLRSALGRRRANSSR